MNTNWCVFKEISIEIGMINFGMMLLVTALTKETYFSNQQKNNIGKVKVVFKTFMKNFFSPVKPAVMKWFLFHFVFSRSKLRIPGLPTATQLRRLRQLLSLVALFKPYWTRKKKSVVLFLYWWYFLALWYWIYFPKSYFLLKFLHFFNSSQWLRRSLLNRVALE